MSFYIPIILGSVRKGRQSPKAAKFLFKRLQKNGKAETEILDLLEYNFPIMEERLRFSDNSPPRLREFADKIARSDALVVVSPEYNFGYPGVLKNALDYLLPEYQRKPIAFVTVSAGSFGGLNCLVQLRQVAFGVGALPIPVSMPVPRVQDAFDDDGNPRDSAYEKRAQDFINELLWYTEAITAQRAKVTGAAS